MYEKFGAPGKIIEACEMKGFSSGGAQVSNEHANFIINADNATSSDIMSLVSHVRDNVYRKTSYWLDCEVRYVRPDGLVKPMHHFF